MVGDAHHVQFRQARVLHDTDTSEESEHDPLPPASQIEPPRSWIKGELIGSGAFGRVYLGLNNDTGRLMAIKEVPFNRDKIVAGRVARHVKALEDEIRVLQRISHPNVVQYYVRVLEDGGTTAPPGVEGFPLGTTASQPVQPALHLSGYLCAG